MRKKEREKTGERREGRGERREERRKKQSRGEVGMSKREQAIILIRFLKQN